MASLQKNKGAVRRFGRIMRFATWLQGLPEKITPPPFRLLQIGSAFWKSRALYVAARLDIASVLGAENLSSDDIAARVEADPDATYRLLRMLAAMGVFEETGARRFRNNRVSDFLRGDKPGNLRAMVLMHNSEQMSRPWYEQLENGVRGKGIPFALTHGQDLFGYMDDHPPFDSLFSQAMDSVEALVGEAYLTDFDWGRFERVIDVGGSKGAKALALLKRYPNLRALVFDRDNVIAEAPGFWAEREEAPLLARTEFQAGDLLEAVPAARGPGDVYLLSAVLHGFDDATCVSALRNLAAAIGDTGASIAVMEMVVDESRADFASASFDMQMFMGTSGRERTLNEWLTLFEKSGVALKEVVATRSFARILHLQLR